MHTFLFQDTSWLPLFSKLAPKNFFTRGHKHSNMNSSKQILQLIKKHFSRNHKKNIYRQVSKACMSNLINTNYIGRCNQIYTVRRSPLSQPNPNIVGFLVKGYLYLIWPISAILNQVASINTVLSQENIFYSILHGGGISH